MKKPLLTTTILFILTMFITSCGLNESDKESIKFGISLHNLNQHQKFTMDSIEAVSKYKIIELLGVIPEKDWDKFINPHMEVYKSEWNEPYQIEKDYNLTLESYLSYCKTMGYDPKTYINILNK